MKKTNNSKDAIQYKKKQKKEARKTNIERKNKNNNNKNDKRAIEYGNRKPKIMFT